MIGEIPQYKPYTKKKKRECKPKYCSPRKENQSSIKQAPYGRCHLICIYGLNDPDIVSRDSLISFKTALWYWMNTCHPLLTSGQGFGATIRAINGPLECDGALPQPVARRVQHYVQYCHQLGVDTGDNLTC